MNKNERLVHDSLVERDFQVLRTGWPDFLCADPQGDVLGVEVKAPPDQLSEAQAETHFMLADGGIPTVTLYVVEGRILSTGGDYMRRLPGFSADERLAVREYVS